jgi:hypothetical protein
MATGDDPQLLLHLAVWDDDIDRLQALLLQPGCGAYGCCAGQRQQAGSFLRVTVLLGSCCSRQSCTALLRVHSAGTWI